MGDKNHPGTAQSVSRCKNVILRNRYDSYYVIQVCKLRYPLQGRSNGMLRLFIWLLCWDILIYQIGEFLQRHVFPYDVQSSVSYYLIVMSMLLIISPVGGGRGVIGFVDQ